MAVLDSSDGSTLSAHYITTPNDGELRFPEFLGDEGGYMYLTASMEVSPRENVIVKLAYPSPNSETSSLL